MPPKRPRPLDVDGVMCTVGASGIVNVGDNPGWLAEERYIVKVKPGADDEACRAKVKTKPAEWAIVQARAAGRPVAMDLDDDDATASCEEAGGSNAGAAGETTGGQRYNTRGAAAPIDRFSDSKHSTFSEYELSRLGARHERTRDVSYFEATQKLEEMGLQAEAWLHEVRRIVTQMDIILDEMPPEHAAAARALQSALIEMVAEAEVADEGEEGGECEACEACDDEGTPSESNAPTDAERAAAAYFQEVTEAVGWSSEGAPPSPPPRCAQGVAQWLRGRPAPHAF